MECSLFHRKIRVVVIMLCVWGRHSERNVCMHTHTHTHTHKCNDVNYPLEVGPIFILRAYLSNFRDIKISFL